MSTLNIGLYNQDFYAWTKEQVRLIKEGLFNKIDMQHLQEEIESMGISEVRGLESRFEVLLTHLLKWKYQPTHRVTSWELTVKEQRLRIKKMLKKMPSLKSVLDEVVEDGYESSIFEAAKQTKLSLKAFPEVCEWTLDQILDENFYPR